MIVERKTYKTRPFCAQKAMDFIMETQRVFGAPNVARIYRAVSGPSDIICREIEFKDWQEREQYWADFFALPQMPEWIEKWKELTQSGGSIEFYRLFE